MDNLIKHVKSFFFVWVTNFVFVISLLFLGFVLVQIFFFSSFKIPTESMAPELVAGDNVLVAKPILGARIFNVFASLRGEQPNISRIPGFRNIKRNDVLVFNFPHPTKWSKIEMHILKYYIKRCIALPGDSVSIRDGFYGVIGVTEKLGNRVLQQKLSDKLPKDIDKMVYNTFPYELGFDWNVKEFGPLYVPRKGDVIAMTRLNAILYRKIIEWEQKGTVSIVDGTVLLDGNPIRRYEFKKNYYFMAGDRVEDSQDSRYWGLLPEEYIVGKAWVIWKSVDKYTGAYRWNRFFKRIN
jgi:signal peptidase I